MRVAKFGLLIVLLTIPFFCAQGYVSSFSSTKMPTFGQSTPDQETGHQPADIPNMHRQPFFWTVMFASLLGWVLGVVKGFDGSRDWLTKYWPKFPRSLLFALDLMIFVFVGAYIGTGMYQPANFTAALGAGLTWPIGLGALASKTVEKA